MVLAAALVSAAGAAAQTGDRWEPSVQTLGPFVIGERTFIVKLSMAQAPDTTSPPAVESVEIADAAGAVHWQRRLAYRTEEGKVEEAVTVDVQPLRGRRGEGLLLAYSAVAPGAPANRSWQAFGVVDGKLRPLSKPVALEGELPEYSAGRPVQASFDEPLNVDVLNFRVWTGRFYTVVPVALQWDWGMAQLAYPLKRCRFNVVAAPGPAPEGAAVDLYTEPVDGSASSAVALRRDSRVEVLLAEGEPIWEDSGEEVSLGVSEDLWLRVRIDGQEGWLHTEAAFDVIGLTEKN
jgi:hypothetical protein